MKSRTLPHRAVALFQTTDVLAPLHMRDRIVNIVLFACLIVITPGLIATLPRTQMLGWHPLIVMQFMIPVLFAITFFLRRRLPFNVRGGVLVGTFLFFGTCALCVWGLTSAGGPVLLMACVFATLCWGARGGAACTAINGLIYLAVGLLVTSRTLELAVDVADYAYAFVNWFTGAVVLVCFGTIAIAGLHGLNSWLVRSLGKLSESEERYRTLFESSTDGVAIIEEDRIIACNEAAIEMFDLTREELLQTTPWELAPPKQRSGRCSRDYALEMLEKCITQGHQFFEYRHQRANGERFDAEISLNHVPLSSGTRVVFAIIRDITERKQAEDLRRLLMSELDHRVRNNITTVLSLIPMTNASCTSKEDFVEILTGRIRAIATAQEGLAARNWQGIGIHRVIRTILDQYLVGEPDRLAVQGEDVDLPAGVSGPFSMCLNELATNAVKHGALSTDVGRIDLSWNVDADQKLHVHWRESGAPPVRSEPEMKPGRGLGIIAGFVEHQLRGTFTIDATTEGVDISISFPLEEHTYQTHFERVTEPPAPD